MTLSISDKDRSSRTVLVYTGITLFCGLFSVIYEYFSHNVWSGFMVWMFLIPLLGGVIPFMLVRGGSGISFPKRIPFNLYNSGIATLTVGSCLQGVLEIYGTTSDFMPVYLIAGTVLLTAGIAVYLMTETNEL